jgi:CRP-like cAMP-binding protein
MGFAKRNAPNCDTCRFKKDCFFWSLKREAQRQWKDLRTANNFQDGDIIFYDGEKPNGLYVVCSGKAKIYKTSRNGQQLITRIVGPAQPLGYRSMLADENHAGSSEAMQESVVSFIDQEAFYQFLKTHPDAMMSLLKQLAHDVRESQDKARDLAHKPAKARVSDALIRMMYVDNHNQPVVTGVKRKEIAEMTGLTVETTVRVLQDLEAKGLIRRKEKAIVILDTEKVKQLSALTS